MTVTILGYEPDEIVVLLRRAAMACDYAAEDYAYRADYERKHNGDEEHDFESAAETYSQAAEALSLVSEAIVRHYPPADNGDLGLPKP